MELFAKPDETLTAHAQRVMELARAICAQLQLGQELTERIKWACLMHDVGKATRSFQRRIQAAGQNPSSLPRAYPHALAGFPFTLALESLLFGPDAPKLATAAVLSHHSPLHPLLYEGYEQPRDLLGDALQAWLKAMLPPSVWDELHLKLPKLLAVNPSEWLHREASYPDGSRTLMAQFQRLPVQAFTTVKAVLCLADWLASAKRNSHAGLFLSDGAQHLQQYLQQQSFKLHNYQQQMQAQSSSRLYLHAPTGAGKTEALLLWAGDSQRILYLLPTQATVNAMYRRLQDIYGKERVGLAHARAILELSREEEEPPLDYKLFSSVFATPVTVATLDQYLLAHLHGRHWEIRRALCRYATVLMDEIHAYEPYTLGLLKAALENDPPARLAIASATLPSPLRERIGDAPLIVAEHALWEQRRHSLLLDDRPLDKALVEALHYARNGETVLFVVNIVPLAQRLYRQAMEWAQTMAHPPTIHLLHSRFIYRDRHHKEQAIQHPSPGTLLIATQVVEVSLNISYQRLYTELAPLDALVQRMGRINRRGERQKPAEVHIIRPYDPRSDHLYGKQTMENTIKLLDQLPKTPTNRELSEAVDQLYQTLWDTPEFQSEFQQGWQTLQEVESICGCYTIDLTEEQMRQRFTTRRGEIHVEVLPEPFQAEAYHLREAKRLWQLPDLLVSVPYWWLIRFHEYFTPARDLGVYLTTLPYDANIGLAHPATLGEDLAISWEYI